MVQGTQAFTARLWIWTITPGGNNRPPDEYRIQLTGGSKDTKLVQIEPESGGKTLLMGWWPDAEVFGAWDYNAHKEPLGSSPSCQVKEGTLRKAAVDSMAFQYRDDPGEYVIAFRPKMLGIYLSQMESLHKAGAAGQDVALLERAVADPDTVTDAEIDAEADQERRRIIVNVRRAVRAYRFGARVMETYGHACVFCGMQLRLLDAAHILPVAHPGGVDKTSNGIAVCTLHHRAYDNGLITFDHKGKILVNEHEIAALKDAGMAGGLKEFKRTLLPQILLASNPADRPTVATIRAANKHRGWGAI